MEVASSWRRKFPHPPNDDDLDGLLGSNSDDEEEEEGGGGKKGGGDVCESSIRSDVSTSSRSTTGSRRPMTISSLQRFVFQAVDDVKSNLPEHPWHKALRFVSFDLPLQRAHVLEWIDMLVKKGELYDQEEELKAAIRRRRSESDDGDTTTPIKEEDVLSTEDLKKLSAIRQGVRAQDTAIRAQVLASLPPSAQGSPQTVAFLDSMLMPLREYFVASLVCSLLSQVSTSPLPTTTSVSNNKNSNAASASRRGSSASCSLSHAQIDSMSGSMRENDMIAPTSSLSADQLHRPPQDFECAFSPSPTANNNNNNNSSSVALEASSISSSTTDTIRKRVPTTFACHHHAALHAKDLATVHHIDTLTPTNPVGLYQFVHAAVGGNADNIIIGDGLGTPGTVERIQPGTTSMADIAGTTTPGRLITMLKRATNKSKAVPTTSAPSSSLGKGAAPPAAVATGGSIPFQSRYAQYHLIYLDDSMDWDDTTFIAAMMPLAESGLAHAQYDMGMCFLSLRETDEACSWLERACKYGHSKAALTLARLHLSMAFEADTIVDKNPSDKSQEVLDAAKVPPKKKDDPTTTSGASLSQIAPNAAASRNKLTMNSGGAINGFAKMDRETKIRQLTHFHVSKALLWLKKLSQCNWDADTVFKDIPDGEALKAMIERDATALIDARAKKDQDISRRWRLSLRISSLCVFAVALAFILAYLVGWLDGSFWDEYEGGGGGSNRGLFDSFFPRYMYRSILDGIYGGQYAIDPATGKRILLYSSGGTSDAERSPQYGYKKSKEPSHVRAHDEATHVRRHY